MKTHLKSDEELLLHPARRRYASEVEQRIADAEETMARMIGEAMWGNGPEKRAALLRQSVTGEAPPPLRITGLDAATTPKQEKAEHWRQTHTELGAPLCGTCLLTNGHHKPNCPEKP